MTAFEDALIRANRMIRTGQCQDALRLANACLEEAPDDALPLFLAGMAELKLGRRGVAYSLFRRASEADPRRAEIWTNLGVCLRGEQHLDQAKQYFLRAFEIGGDDPDLLSNLSSVEIGLGNHERALAWAEQALKLDPRHRDASTNFALACFHLGRWREGWRRYKLGIGGSERASRNYHADRLTPRWRGERSSVVIYGEQGLGDELLFASMIPDAIGRAKQVIVDCDSRLAGLFRRSFPGAVVHGTREQDELAWPMQLRIDAALEMGGLGELYRNEASAFPGTPYLVPDPERRLQWRALLDSLGDEPKIGIAWTGGTAATGRAQRSLPLRALEPILQHKAHWISLQHEDPAAEIAAFEAESGIRVIDWAHGTRTRDYDDTAALVAELDLVLAVTTSIVDLCGAIGKECWVLVNRRPQWRYSMEPSPWYRCLRLFREDETGWPILGMAAALAERFRLGRPDINVLISPDYRRLNQLLHADIASYGAHGHKWADVVFDLATAADEPAVLDYGCGKGTLKAALAVRGIAVRECDPAIPGKATLPDPARLVVCTDVLEHVEPDRLDAVLDHLRDVTLDTAFVVIATAPAAKALADGRNAHLIVEPAEWWLERLGARFAVASAEAGASALVAVLKRRGIA